MATPLQSTKIKITNYTFDKAAKTVTFSDYATILLDSILCVINVTKGIVIYVPNDSTLGGTVLTNVLTLAYDTSAMANTDKLLIYYDDPTIGAIGKTIKVAYTASQTAATVLTPTAGKKVFITDFIVSPTAAGTVYLFDNTDSASTAITPTLNLNSIGGISKSFKKPFESAAVNNVIKYTSGAGAAGSIFLNYYEI